MKAIKITGDTQGKVKTAPLPLPMRERRGKEDVSHYRRQAKGEEPIGDFSSQPSKFMRTIRLADGGFDGLFTQPGPLLTFILSGRLTVLSDEAPIARFEGGDVFLAEDIVSNLITLDAQDDVRLIQIDVPPHWPGPDAKVQEPGTVVPRPSPKPNFKRMYTGADNKAYFADFSELVPAERGKWTAPRPIQGFRMSCWSSGQLDFHPGVVNQIGLVMSGALKLEVSGDGSEDIFYAGDVCLAQDKTGEGHRNTKIGLSHTMHIVFSDEHLWPFTP